MPGRTEGALKISAWLTGIYFLIELAKRSVPMAPPPLCGELGFSAGVPEARNLRFFCPSRVF